MAEADQKSMLLVLRVTSIVQINVTVSLYTYPCLLVLDCFDNATRTTPGLDRSRANCSSSIVFSGLSVDQFVF